MKKICFIFLFPFLFALSCDKDKNISSGVTGTVQDKTTNTPVAEAEVALFEKDDEIFGGMGGVMLESKFADSNGCFHFGFTERSGYNYYVQAIKAQYWNDQSNNITFVNSGDEDAVVYLQPEGYLKIHFQNILPSSSSDIFGINGYMTDVLYGDLVDTSITYTAYGNTMNELHWTVGYEPTLSDTIYCPSFDTTYYEIFY